MLQQAPLKVCPENCQLFSGSILNAVLFNILRCHDYTHICPPRIAVFFLTLTQVTIQVIQLSLNYKTTAKKKKKSLIKIWTFLWL